MGERIDLCQISHRIVADVKHPQFFQRFHALEFVNDIVADPQLL